MEKLLKQVSFDLMACRFLERIDAAVTPGNLSKARELFNNDSDLILDSIIGLDQARAINSEESTISVYKIKKRRKKAA